MAASARAAVDLAVPFSPRTRTPPILGLIELSTRPSFIRSWPTRAVNGKMGRMGPATDTSLRLGVGYVRPLPTESNGSRDARQRQDRWRTRASNPSALSEIGT